MITRFLPCIMLMAVGGFAQVFRMDFPQIAVGDDYVTILTLSNPGTHTFNGDIGILDNAGDYLPVDINGLPVANKYPLSIGPGSLITLRLTRAGSTVTGHAIVWDQDASVAVRDLEAQISGSVVFQYRQQGLVLDSIGVSPGAVIERGTINAESTDTVFTGLALSNPFGEPLTVTITALAVSGEPLASTTVFLSSHQAFFLHEKFSIPPTGFKGIVIIESSQRIGVTALRLEGSQLSTLPVMPRYSTYDFTIATSDSRIYQGELLLNVGGEEFWGLIRWTNPPADQPVGTSACMVPGTVRDNGGMGAIITASMSGKVTTLWLAIDPPFESADSLTGFVLWEPSGSSALPGTFSATRRR